MEVSIETAIAIVAAVVAISVFMAVLCTPKGWVPGLPPNYEKLSPPPPTPMPPCKYSTIPAEVRLTQLEQEVSELKLSLERLIGETYED